MPKRTKRFKTSPAQAMAIIAMWKDGMTATDISSTTGVPTNVIYQAMSRLRKNDDTIGLRGKGGRPVWTKPV